VLVTAETRGADGGSVSHDNLARHATYTVAAAMADD
jgi:hypothetical protein